jgi:ABC-type sugar transport system permease subunit
VNDAWPWLALLGLGAFHGINPGMGWLFAVALGLQEQRRSAVWNALPPIAVGHALSVGLVVALVAVIHASIPYQALRWIAVTVLIGFGVYRLVRARHPRWVGMRVGFRDLTLWSFLMASAHGAGLMLVPVFLATTQPAHVDDFHSAHGAHSTHGAHLELLNHPWLTAVAVVVHTLGHLLVAGLVAMIVYEKLGVRILQRAWFNFDLAWAVALIVSGLVTAAV